ncbi:hypothetical protein CCMA1212_005998 [Trichoderma ghanense]|uniref:Uncharacterized protein n=1 Tax=Trichoderma ghanense TaxID=65468 RepID=A0ABY2H2R9_9HYPO
MARQPASPAVASGSLVRPSSQRVRARLLRRREEKLGERGSSELRLELGALPYKLIPAANRLLPWQKS